MLRPVRRFLSLGTAQRRMFLQACVRLGAVRFALRSRSFRQMIEGLSVLPGLVAPPATEPAGLEQARAIGWAVRAASRYTPWSSTCLVQVLAAQQMLRERAIPGAFYIGAAPGEKGAGPVGLEAHAWLKCGEQFITGEAGHQRYTVVSTFLWP